MRLRSLKLFLNKYLVMQITNRTLFATYDVMSHLLVEQRPAAQQPAAALLTGAGPAVAAPPEQRPSSRSEQRALCRSAASPPGWSKSVCPDSSSSLIGSFRQLKTSKVHNPGSRKYRPSACHEFTL